VLSILKKLKNNIFFCFLQSSCSKYSQKKYGTLLISGVGALRLRGEGQIFKSAFFAVKSTIFDLKIKKKMAKSCPTAIKVPPPPAIKSAPKYKQNY
jgi:hypothetical protein